MNRPAQDKPARPRRSFESYLWSVFELPLAFAFAYALMLAVAWAGCSMKRYGCPDVSGVGWLLGGAVVGIVAAVFYWCIAFALGDRVRKRLILDAFVIAVAVAPYVIAWNKDRIAAQRVEAEKQRTMPPPIAR